MEKRILAYGVVSTLEMLGWGIYLAFFARYLSVALKGGAEAVVVFTSLNWGFTLLSVLVSKLLSIMSERGVILLGMLCSIPPFIVLFSNDPLIIASIAPLSALPWGLMWSVVVKSVFHSSSDRPGWGYGVFTAGRGVGAFLGSVLTGPLYAVGGTLMVVIAIAFALTVSVFSYYGLHKDSSMTLNGNTPRVTPVISKLWMFYASLVAVVFARELLYAMGPPKLDSDLKLLLKDVPEWVEYAVFGAVYSGGALLSPIARLLAGRLVDRHGALPVYLCTTVGYAALYWIFMKTSGVTPILAWQIPLFPFLDTSVNVYVAKNLDVHEIPLGVASSLTFTAIGGLLVLLVLLPGRIHVDLAGLVMSSACVLAALLALAGNKQLVKSSRSLR